MASETWREVQVVTTPQLDNTEKESVFSKSTGPWSQPHSVEDQEYMGSTNEAWWVFINNNNNNKAQTWAGREGEMDQGGMGVNIMKTLHKIPTANNQFLK